MGYNRLIPNTINVWVMTIRLKPNPPGLEVQIPGSLVAQSPKRNHLDPQALVAPTLVVE